MTRTDLRAMALAFRDRRVTHRGDVTTTQGTLVYRGHAVAWRDPVRGIQTTLFGRPHETVAVLNALCTVYRMRPRYRYDPTFNAFYFDNAEIGTLTIQTLITPLAAQVAEVEARAK